MTAESAAAIKAPEPSIANTLYLSQSAVRVLSTTLCSTPGHKQYSLRTTSLPTECSVPVLCTANSDTHRSHRQKVCVYILTIPCCMPPRHYPLNTLSRSVCSYPTTPAHSLQPPLPAVSQGLPFNATQCMSRSCSDVIVEPIC